MSSFDESTDKTEVIHAVGWLMVLASRTGYHSLERKPPPEHLIRLLDIYIAYVARGGHYHPPMFQPAPYERREPLAAKLRAILETWTPSELPDEVVEAARDLLHAEGLQGPGNDWGALPLHWFDPDFLLWPEGIPALLAVQRAASEASPWVIPDDNMDVIHTVLWLMVLASRRGYHSLGREPSPEHLIRLLDVYIAYAARDDRYHQPMFQPVPYERRVPLATRLRAILETWTPSEPSDEVIEAVRTLLYAEGIREPSDGWENPTLRNSDPELLLWPEGVPALLAMQQNPPL